MGLGEGPLMFDNDSLNLGRQHLILIYKNHEITERERERNAENEL